MSAPAELTLTVEVDASARRTFDAAVDWEHQGEWMIGTRVEATHAGGHGVGGRFQAFSGVGRLGFLDTMVVTEWQAPEAEDAPGRCAVEHTGRVVRGSGVFAVEPLGPGRSRFVWSERLDLPLGALGRIGWRLGRPLFAAGVQHSLRTFARWVPTHH